MPRMLAACPHRCSHARRGVTASKSPVDLVIRAELALAALRAVDESFTALRLVHEAGGRMFVRASRPPGLGITEND